MRRRLVLGALLAGLAVAGAARLLGGERPGLHDRLREARLEAELSHGAPTLFASEPPDASALADASWPQLLEAAAQAPPHERWRAIRLLGALGDRRAVPALLTALADARNTVRPCLAAQSLGRLGDPRAVDALLDATRAEGNTDLRLCAIKSLGLLGKERAVPALVERVERGDLVVTASFALSRIATPRGARVVARAARDSPEIRPWLVRPLGAFGRPEAERALRAIASEPDALAATREDAREALWRSAVLREDDRGAALERVLGGASDAERRRWAAFRLGEAGDPAAAPALAAALGDPAERVRLAAGAALLRLGEPAVPSLLARLEGPAPARSYAVALLGLAGDGRAVEALRALGSRDEAGRPKLVARSLRWLRVRGVDAPRVASAGDGGAEGGSVPEPAGRPARPPPLDED